MPVKGTSDEMFDWQSQQNLVTFNRNLIKSFSIKFRIFEVLKKIISISLTLILLLGNIGITYGTHFCMDMALKSELMIGHENMDCGMGTMDSSDDNNKEPHFTAPDCCQNEYKTLETDNLFSKSVSQKVPNLVFVASLASVVFEIPLYQKAKTPYIHYSPPLPDQDILVLNQVFRI